MKLDSVEIGLNSFYMLDKVEKKSREDEGRLGVDVNLKLQLELPKMAKYKERIHYKTRPLSVPLFHFLRSSNRRCYWVCAALFAFFRRNAFAV